MSQSKSKKRARPAPPITTEPWPDGINPQVDPDRRQAILDARKARAQKIEEYRKRTSE